MTTNDLNNLRHSCAHLLAAAVLELWPNAKRTIGPAIENGFYYDFDFGDSKISDADLPKIVSKMHELVKSWDQFESREVSLAQAQAEYPDNTDKLELINELKEQKLTLDKSGDYEDLCRGGHVDSPKNELKYFKLTHLAGAYWRGNEKNKMLTRIYGTIWPSKEELDSYLQQQEQAEERDNRKLGKELELYTISPSVGPGLILWLPNGTILRE